MTRLPTDNQVDLVPLEGPGYPKYKVSATCSVPFCNQYSDHAHHIVRRSFLGGDYAWVKYPDGKVFANLTGMCYLHHKHVTENRAQISYEDGVFYWDKYVGEPTPLAIQPFTIETIPSDIDQSDDHRNHDHHSGDPTRAICEGCGRPLPKPKLETPEEEKKPRKTWAISVPNDAIEDGADTLDALLEAARDDLDLAGLTYGNGSKVKYYVLSTSLGLFVQHSKEILSNK